MKIQTFNIFGLLSSAVISFCAASESQPPLVTLSGTQVVGTRNEKLNVDFFGGLPFAEPPLDKLRFRPPVLKTSINSSVFDASQSGLACLQTDLPPNAVSEDCLTLDIFRPSDANVDYSREKLPLLFWLYGGGWLIGSAGRYNGSRLVSRSVTRGSPVLLVTANYRLGPFGFPQGEEAASDDAVNLALKDHIAALRWVNLNIGTFGGDPSKVTIFGESAGARSIDLLLFYDEINELASGAILESDGGPAYLEPSLTGESWSGFVSAVVPCVHTSDTNKTLDCLRGQDVSTNDFLEALNTVGIAFNNTKSAGVWSPVIDGKEGLIPRYPSQSPIMATFPIIIGGCLDEGTLFRPQAPSNISSDDMIRTLIKASAHRPPGREKEIQRITDGILEAYPDIPSLGSPFGTGNDTFGLDKGYKRVSAVVGDLLIHSHRRLMLQRLAQRPNVPVFSYVFAEPNDGVITVPPEFVIAKAVPGSLGVPHASEVFYVFGVLEDELGPKKVAPTSSELSQVVMDYWISFAVTGNPSDGKGAQRPRWAPFNPSDPMLLQLKGQDTRMIPDNFREEGISVLNEDPTALRQ